jgi:hypothetical protein
MLTRIKRVSGVEMKVYFDFITGSLFLTVLDMLVAVSVKKLKLCVISKHIGK